MKSTHIGTAQTRFLRFQNLSYPTMVFQVVIEFLNVPGSQLVQFDVSDVWNAVARRLRLDVHATVLVRSDMDGLDTAVRGHLFRR